MTWISHGDDLFNLDAFPYICRQGDFDIALFPEKEADPDSEKYFVIVFDSEDERDEAFGEIMSRLSAKSLT